MDRFVQLEESPVSVEDVERSMQIHDLSQAGFVDEASTLLIEWMSSPSLSPESGQMIYNLMAADVFRSNLQLFDFASGKSRIFQLLDRAQQTSLLQRVASLKRPTKRQKTAASLNSYFGKIPSSESKISAPAIRSSDTKAVGCFSAAFVGHHCKLLFNQLSTASAVSMPLSAPLCSENFSPELSAIFSQWPLEFRNAVTSNSDYAGPFQTALAEFRDLRHFQNLRNLRFLALTNIQFRFENKLQNVIFIPESICHAFEAATREDSLHRVSQIQQEVHNGNHAQALLHLQSWMMRSIFTPSDQDVLIEIFTEGFFANDVQSFGILMPTIYKFSCENQAILQRNWAEIQRDVDPDSARVRSAELNQQINALFQDIVIRQSLTESECREVFRDRIQGSSCAGSVEATSVNLSLVDPVTLVRIVTPVRGIMCLHLQAFDLESYLSRNMLLETRARRLSRGKIRCLEWLCPICRELCSPEDLRVDVVVQKFLKSTNCSVNEIIVDSQYDDLLEVPFKKYDFHEVKEEPRESAPTFEVKRNINAMSDIEILSLHGIPHSVLKAVVNFRNTLGQPVLNISSLKNIAGIGPLQFQKLESLLMTSHG